MKSQKTIFWCYVFAMLSALLILFSTLVDETWLMNVQSEKTVEHSPAKMSAVNNEPTHACGQTSDRQHDVYVMNYSFYHISLLIATVVLMLICLTPAASSPSRSQLNFKGRL